MKGTIVILGCLFAAYAAPLFGNEVPLILDETIQLPEIPDVWDVFPQWNGEHYWVAAQTPTDTSISINWGITGTGEAGSFMVQRQHGPYPANLYSQSFLPKSIAAFERADLQGVCLGLLDYFQYMPSCQATFNICDVRVLDVESGADIAPLRSQTGHCDDVFPPGRWRVTGAPIFRQFELIPNGPEPTTTILAIGKRHDYDSGGSFADYGTYVANCLDSSQTTIVNIHNLTPLSVCQWSNGIDALGGLSARHYFTGAIVSGNEVLVRSDRLIYNEWMDSDTLDAYPTHMQYVLVDDMFANRRLAIIRSHDGWVDAIDIDRHQRAWRQNGTYDSLLTAYVLIGDYSEQLLLWRQQDRLFDVLRVETGQIWGQTSPLDAGYAEMKIIGRYHNETRRLAVRYGSELRIYRFGDPIYADADDARPAVPNELTLSAYPNPFNPATMIAFYLPKAARASLVVYDLNGRQVQTLLDGQMSGGHHEVGFDGAALPSGIYFARLVAGDLVKTQKMVLLK